MQTAISPGAEDVLASGSVRILVAADDVPARLTLEAVLGKSGYAVDSAASSAEAMEKIECGQYALVLCNLHNESPDATPKTIRLARMQDYRPATAVLTTSSDRNSRPLDSDEVLVEPVEIAALLTKIAELIGSRAVGRAHRAARRGVA